MPPSQISSLARTLRTFERAINLPICFRELSSIWSTLHPGKELSRKFRQHTNPFCCKTKEHQLPACYRDCVYALKKQAVSQPEGFLFTCHAGATELRMPVWENHRLVGMLHLGPFRTSADNPEFADLPEIAPHTIPSLQIMMAALRDHLEALFALAPHPQKPASNTVLQRIEIFVDNNMRDDPGRDDVARFLHKSPNWISHYIRRQTGQTFQQIKDDRRLALARQMLLNSHLKIEAVAVETGFRDVNYFYRFFREKTGTTPARYRAEHARAQDMV